MVFVADIRVADEAESIRVAHLPVDGVLVLTAAGFDTAQRRREVVDARLKQRRRLIQVQMSLLWHTVPDSVCTAESVKPLLVRTQNS